MRALGIDPGATSGWALSDPVLSGAINHSLGAMLEWRGELPERGMASSWSRDLTKEERLKRTLGAYLNWLLGLIENLHPDVLILERQAPFKGRANTNAVEYRGITLAAAGMADIALLECFPAQWRPFLNGRPYDPAKDHQIAAQCLLAWYRSSQ